MSGIFRNFPSLLFAGLFAFAAVTANAVAAPDPPACVGNNLIVETKRSDPESFQLFTQSIQGIPNREGLFWKIRGKGVKPSYLFGTIHVTDARAVTFARSTRPYIRRSKLVVTELGDALNSTSSTALGVKIGFQALFGGNDKLSIIKSAADRVDVERALANRGISRDFANRLEPWMILAMLAVPQCEQDRLRAKLPVVDAVIVEIGKKEGIKISALETMSEQLDVLANMEPELLEQVLVSTAKTENQANDRFVTMLALYHERMIGNVSEALKLSTPRQDRQNADIVERRFMERLLDERNIRMKDRSLPILGAGSAFIAVGALHLIGKAGLVELYRQAGFKVSRIW